MLSIFNQPPADPITEILPFTGSAWPVTLLIFSYLIFVLKIGKKLMENREPYNLKTVLIVYNSFQVLYNAAMTGFMFYHIILVPLYDLRCMTTLPLDHPQKNVERLLSYAYYINKIIDLLDTVFFVLRKSHKQITFLHVFHHILMVYSIYWIVRFYGFGGPYSTMGLFNSFVHTLMYFYYLIAAKYSGLKGNLWWKKYITVVQIIQFLTLLSQALWVLLFNPACPCPKILQYILVACSTTFLIMFGNFYIDVYVIKPTKTTSKNLKK